MGITLLFLLKVLNYFPVVCNIVIKEEICFYLIFILEYGGQDVINFKVAFLFFLDDFDE